MLVLAQVAANGILDPAVDHAADEVAHDLAVQDLAALLVDDATLDVHHVVVLQGVLPGLEVLGLDLLLGVLDGAGEDLGVDGGVVVDLEGFHHLLHPLGAEQTHDVVLHAEVEAALAGVALTAGTAAQLVVDAAGLVALGAQDEQAAGFADLVGLRCQLLAVFILGVGEHLPGLENGLVVGLGKARGLGDEVRGEAGLLQVVLGQELGVAAQHDVGTTAGHVGGDGDGAELTGLGDDLCFLLVILCVQHVVLDAFLIQQPGEDLGLLDGGGTGQDGLALLVAGHNLAHDGVVLAGGVLIHLIGVVHTDHGLVGGDLDDVQLIGGAELLLLGQGGTGHTGELLVQAEVVLEGDGGQGLGLAGDRHAFLGLDGLVQTVVVAAAIHQTAGELIDDDDLAVLHHIVDVPLHETSGADGLVDVVGEGGVLRVGEVLYIKCFLSLGDAAGGQGDGTGLFIDDVIGVNILVLFLLVVHGGLDQAGQTGGKAVGQGVELGGLLAHARDDQGGPGLVDQDGVHLVDDGEGVAALHELGLVDGHVVTQVVEAELVVGAVGDVGVVGSPLAGGVDPVDDQAHGQAQEAVDLAHPVAVALGQVVVDGDDVHALAAQGVQVGGQGSHQGLAFTGLHLGDAALVQDDAADELHPVGAQAQHTVGCLTAGGKGLRQQVVQGLAVFITLLQLRGLGLELGIGIALVFFLQDFDLADDGIKALDLLRHVGSKQFG